MTKGARVKRAVGVPFGGVLTGMVNVRYPTGMARPYRREQRYPERLAVNVDADLRAAIDSEAEAGDTSVAAVLRDAVRRGLPLVRDARRKRRRQAARNGA